MKKITFLFSLLLTFLGVSSVHAAVGDVITNLSQLSNTKIYTITGPRATLKQGETSLAGTGKNTTADSSDPAQKFLILNKNGNYFLFAYGKDQFVNASQEAGAYGEPQAFAITTNTHDATKATYPWRFTFNNKVLNFDNDGLTVNISGWTNQDGGNAFKFTEVGDLNDEAKAAAMEFACSKYNANQIVTQHDVDRPFTGTQTNWESVQNVLNTYADKTYSTIGDDAKTATNAIDAAYSKFMTEYVNVTDGMQVLLGNKLHTSLYVYAKETNKKSQTGGYLGSGSAKNSYRYLFTFKDAGNGKFKIYSNYYNKYVGAVPSEANIEFPLVDEANAQAFTVSISKYYGYGNIYDENTTTVNEGVVVNALHMVNWDGVVRWETAAPASAFKFIPVTSDITDAWDAAIIKKASNTEGYVGYQVYTSEVASALNTFQAASAETKGTAYKALEDVLSAGELVKPVAGKYYTIENACSDNSNKFIIENYGVLTANSENQLVAKSYEKNIVPALWKFEQLTTEGKTDLYHIIAANSGKCMSRTAYGYTMHVTDADNANVGEFNIFTKDHVSKDFAVTLVTYTKSDRTDRGTASMDNGGGAIKSWNAIDNNNNWRIKEVTEIPVSISAVGYATLNLPCAVTIPTDVKAYTATDGETEVTLSEITDGVIPANTPVILVGTEGIHNFTIQAENTTAAITPNALNGTLVPTAVAADASAYILKKGDHGIGMYKITSETDRTIAANKAYMGSTAGASASNVKTFNFGGTSTGINNVVVGNAKNNVYYDLNGRRVLYPAHGVFVKANGEKVYIK